MTVNSKGLAIVMSGGGMRSAFGAGAMCALAKEYGIKEPELLICSSGSAGTGAYYLAQQYDSIKRIWCELLASKRFLNMKRIWRVMNIDYLIDNVFKLQERLNDKKVKSSNTKFLIPVMNRRTGEVRYFSNRENVDIFECLRAAKAMPFLYHFKPNVNIRGASYCDSPYSARSLTGVKEAMDLGMKKILVIDNLSVQNRMSRIIDKLVRLDIFNRKAKKKYDQEEQELECFEIPHDIDLYRIIVGEEIGMSAFNNQKEKLKNAFKMGYELTANDNKLKKWLN